MAPSLPDFADLPVREGLPPGSSWGVWGDDDRLGCLNLLGEERTRAGLSAVVDARVFSLNLELDLPDPPLFGRPAFRHDVSWLAGGAGHDDSLSDWNTQSSSQWDGFRHIRHPLYGFYGGVDDERQEKRLCDRRSRGGPTRFTRCARLRTGYVFAQNGIIIMEVVALNLANAFFASHRMCGVI